MHNSSHMLHVIIYQSTINGHLQGSNNNCWLNICQKKKLKLQKKKKTEDVYLEISYIDDFFKKIIIRQH